MAQLPVTVNINGINYSGTVDVPTVRVPELPPNILPFDPQDTFPLHDFSRNTLVHVPITDFREYLITGGNDTGQPPILVGDTLEITIGANDAGVNRVIVPALAGKTYTLARRGVEMLKINEWNILPSGGFELKDRDDNGNPVAVGTGTQQNVTEGETFFARIYELQVGQNTTVIQSYVDGIANITSSIALVNIHYNKLIHVIGNTNQVTVTLPDIADAAPLNLIIPIETNISNINQTRIATKSGQSIYFGNTSQTDIYLGISESIQLFAGSDGWYVMPGASEGILNVGQPILDYVQRLNTLVGKGQLVAKSSVPRIMKWLTANPTLLVNETLWQSDVMYHGKFSDFDTNSVRFPDLQNRFFRGLNYIGFSDPERSINTPGSLQEDEFEAHTHGGVPLKKTDVDRGTSAANSFYSIDEDGTTGATGGTETRPKNIGLLPLIKI